MRGADVVHEQQVTNLPLLADSVRVVDLVDRLDNIRADWCAVPEAGVERQPVLPVDVDEVLAHLRSDRPLVQECDLVEPAPSTGEWVAHDGAAALPRAKDAAHQPLELDRMGAAVALDDALVVGAEGVGQWRTDVLIVIADQEPPYALEALDQFA